MEVYKHEMEEIIRRFLAGRMTHGECVIGLDAAFAAVMHLITSQQIESARNIFFSSIGVVQKEMGRRYTYIRQSKQKMAAHHGSQMVN